MTKVNTKSVLRLVRDAIETYSPDYMHGLPKRDYLKQIDAALAQDAEWVGLTDEDLSVCDEDGILLAKYWEAKLKEKNHDNTR